jgi:hypothetical protein
MVAVGTIQAAHGRWKVMGRRRILVEVGVNGKPAPPEELAVVEAVHVGRDRTVFGDVAAQDGASRLVSQLLMFCRLVGQCQSWSATVAWVVCRSSRQLLFGALCVRPTI